MVAAKNMKGNAGTYDPKTRIIKINASLSPKVQWQTLYHEWMHMVLFDSGCYQNLSAKAQELLCDSVGQARAFEQLLGTWT